MAIPDSNTSLACLLCKQVYPLTEMRSHLAQIHADYIPHKCLHCDYFSISALEMAQHGLESKHRVVINEAFDAYKEGLVKDLLDNCWKMARGEEPLPELRPSIIQTDAINKPIVESRKGNEKGKEKTEQKVQPREKAIARKATCQLPSCGIMVEVGGSGAYSALRCAQTRHIEEYHVRGHKGMSFACPIDGCPRSTSASVKNPEEEFKKFRVLENHVNKIHKITPKQKADLESLLNRVNAAVRELRPKCFPLEGNQKVALPTHGKSGVSKPKTRKTVKCRLAGCGAELVVNGTAYELKTRHIQEHHVRTQPGLKFHCPVEGCPKSASHLVKSAAGNKDEYKSLSGLSGHIQQYHNLTTEQQVAFDGLTKRVHEEVRKLRYECFP